MEDNVKYTDLYWCPKCGNGFRTVNELVSSDKSCIECHGELQHFVLDKDGKLRAAPGVERIRSLYRAPEPEEIQAATGVTVVINVTR